MPRHDFYQKPLVRTCYSIKKISNFPVIFDELLKFLSILVPDPGEGVCGDPVNRGAILGGGPGPQGGNKERQLSPDKGRGKT